MTTAAQSQSQLAVPRGSIQSGQLKAIWVAARARGLEPHSLVDGRSLKSLSFEEARLLLNRLNGRKDGYNWRRKKRRKPESVVAFATPEQLEVIDRRYRVALGWEPAEMLAHLKARKYKSDPTRTMNSIVSSDDAQGVIEHLKLVLYRTLVFHGRRLGRTDLPELEESPRTHLVRFLMTSLPPHEALSRLLEERRSALRERMGDGGFEAWLADQRLPDGRILAHVAFCHDAAELTYRIEEKLRQLAPKKGRRYQHNAAAAKARNDSPDTDEPHTFKFADYANRRIAQ